MGDLAAEPIARLASTLRYCRGGDSKEKGKDNSRIPRWLNMLQPVISGSYTADNLDYVLRDSYMCGVAVGPVIATPNEVRSGTSMAPETL